MSESNKKKKASIGRIATKPLRMPLNWALPRSAVGASKAFKFSDTRFPVCPNCSMARFVLSEDRSSEEEGYVWECPSCDFTAVTDKGDMVAIHNWYHQNAKEVFDNSEIQKRRALEVDEEDSFSAINVKRNMIASHIFLAFAVFMACLFLYAAWTTNFFFMLNTLLFTLGLGFMGLVFNYRAWQARTNNLYSKDGKAQFHWWLSKHPWYRYPVDIGNPPK